MPVAGRVAPPRRPGGRRRSRAGLLPCPGPGGGLAAGVRPMAGPSPRDRRFAARQLVPPRHARAYQLTGLGLGWTGTVPGWPRRRRPVVWLAALDRTVAGCPVGAAGRAVQGSMSSWGCVGRAVSAARAGICPCEVLAGRAGRCDSCGVSRGAETAAGPNSGVERVCGRSGQV